MSMQRMTCPECPQCGCNDSEVVRTYKSFGVETALRRCAYCGKEFTARAPAPPPVVHEEPKPPTPVFHEPQKTHCPQCDSTETRVSSTRKLIRHHKCGSCSHTFKTARPA